MTTFQELKKKPEIQELLYENKKLEEIILNYLIDYNPANLNMKYYKGEYEFIAFEIAEIISKYPIYEEEIDHIFKCNLKTQLHSKVLIEIKLKMDDFREKNRIYI